MSTRTPAPPPPVREEESDNAPTAARFSLSATQIVASALAATTATVCASYLGVAGTVIGAAVASVLTVVGNAVYSHSIQRTGARVREVVPAAARSDADLPTLDPPPARPKRARERARCRGGRWRRPAWASSPASCWSSRRRAASPAARSPIWCAATAGRAPRCSARRTSRRHEHLDTPTPDDDGHGHAVGRGRHADRHGDDLAGHPDRDRHDVAVNSSTSRPRRRRPATSGSAHPGSSTSP